MMQLNEDGTDSPPKNEWWRKFLPVRPTELAQVYDQADSWVRSVIEGLVRSEKRAWRLIWFLCVMSGISVGTAMYAMYFALEVRPEVFVYAVDKSTGIGEPIKKVGDPSLRHSEQVDRYWVNEFIQCRESYYFFTYAKQYETCSRFMAIDGPVFKEFRAYFDPDKERNPTGPYAVFGEKGTKTVSIRYAPYMTEDKRLMQVHYTLNETHPDGKVEKSHWVATLSFDWGNQLADANYLGFRVTNYRKEKEAME